MDRRKFLLFPLAAVPTCAYAHFVEPEWLEVSLENVHLPGVRSGDPIRVAQLSDLHASPDVPKNLIEESFRLTLAQNPDVVCLTGDFVTSGEPVDWRWYQQTLSKLTDKAKCYAILGNHDSSSAATERRVVQLLSDSGVTLLLNRRHDLSIRSHQIRLVGLGDIWESQCDPQKAFFGVTPDSIPTIALSHNPDSKVAIADYPWHVMLAGHTHGGQVVAPFLNISPAPVRDRRYIKGLKPWRDRLIHVNAGIGNLYGVRFNCRPQISILLISGDPASTDNARPELNS